MKRGTPAPAAGLSSVNAFSDLGDDSTELSGSAYLGSDASSPFSLQDPIAEEDDEEVNTTHPEFPTNVLLAAYSTGDEATTAEYHQQGPNDDEFELSITPRAHSSSSLLALQEEVPLPQQQPALPVDNGVAIVRHIASYLSFSDAESIASAMMHKDGDSIGIDGWTNNDGEGGRHMSSEGDMGQAVTSWSSFLGPTPATPGLMALSPPLSADDDESYCDVELDEEDWEEEDDEDMKRRLSHQRKKWVQQRLTAAVFSHQRSIRSYCLEAHEAAMEIQKNRKERYQHEVALLKEKRDEVDPETLREPVLSTREGVPTPDIAVRKRRRRRKEKEQQLRIIRLLIDTILHNVPLSVAIDLTEAVVETGLDTSFAVFRISSSSVNAVVSALCRVIHKVWDTVIHFNPFALIEAVISLQFNAVGKTSEVLVSGIQSVATAAGYASTAALHRFSRGGGAQADRMKPSSSSISLKRYGKESRDSGVFSKMGLRRNQNVEINKKLLRKLSNINSAAEVIAYKERESDALTRHAKKRVQRMMHYEVSLRPFEATVIIPSPRNEPPPPRDRGSSFENLDPFMNPTDVAAATLEDKNRVTPQSSASSSPLESPFMCTPKSFPPTPSSRSMVMARGTRFVENIVFLARDQLRVEGALESENERTRAMANALKEGNRLAVFNAADAGNGIALTCGQHVATKVGNVLYCSTRSMVPILRNCYVYFEMSVMTPPVGNAILQASLATLSIGLSTLEMPLNTLVGAWKGSVGLCTTGQILTAGQWCSPLDPGLSSYGDNATVGCLVCLDDRSAFETWDGVMVTATVTFNVNGTVVSPPVSTAPMGGTGGIVPAQGTEMDEQHPNIGINDPTGMQPSQQPQQLPGPVSTLPLLVPMEEELFPTLTLHSPATQVMCRFSAQDLLAESRENIGAPPGETVYTVDGSVLFDDDETSVPVNLSL